MLTERAMVDEARGITQCVTDGLASCARLAPADTLVAAARVLALHHTGRYDEARDILLAAAKISECVWHDFFATLNNRSFRCVYT